MKKTALSEYIKVLHKETYMIEGLAEAVEILIEKESVNNSTRSTVRILKERLDTLDNLLISLMSHLESGQVDDEK